MEAVRREEGTMRKLKQNYTLPGLIICCLGLLALWALYVLWMSGSRYSLPAYIAAAASVLLFAAVCLRFVPGWMRFWTPGGYIDKPRAESAGRGILPRIYASLLGFCAGMFALIYVIYLACGYRADLRGFLDFWTLTDSGHYLDIARDWYLSEGSVDRLVQLVFLPGYPLAVRLVHLAVRDWVAAGLLVSWLSFAGAGCVLYCLLRLDYSHAQSLRALRFLCLIPGSFFFVSPMSESLFLLLSLGCVYMARRGSYGAGCALGALASFTRSLGLILFVPVSTQLPHAALISPRRRRRCARFLYLALIPLGFAAYCVINYLVSGDPFKYMQYQSEHWGQNLGFFFNTAAYQLENLISSARSNSHNFLGLWLPNLVFDFAALIFAALSARKMRASYTAWFIAYYVVAIGATWLLSSPRYMISLMPFFLSVSLSAEKPGREIALSAGCAAASLLYAAAFVLRWQVW